MAINWNLCAMEASSGLVLFQIVAFTETVIVCKVRTSSSLSLPIYMDNVMNKVCICEWLNIKTPTRH